MIEQAMSFIKSLADAARRPHVLKIDSEPKDTYLLALADGTIERRQADPAPRAYVAHSLSGLCEMVRAMSKGLKAEKIVVFASRFGVTVLLDETERRDRITMEIRCSTPFTELAAWDDTDSGKIFNQRDTLWKFRSVFGADNITPASFMPELRQIKFKTSSEGESEVNAGRESLGRRVLAEVHGASGALPEMISIACPAFDGLAELEGCPVNVQVCVEVNLVEQKFCFKPSPNEVENCLAAAESRVSEFLKSKIGDVATVLPAAKC